MMKVYVEIINQVKRWGEQNKSEDKSLTMEACTCVNQLTQHYIALCDLLAGESTEGNYLPLQQHAPNNYVYTCMCCSPNISSGYEKKLTSENCLGDHKSWQIYWLHYMCLE